MVSLSPRRSELLNRAISLGLLDGEPPAALFIELEALDARLQGLEQAFPSGTLHAMAMKACPLPGVLERGLIRGFGLECASLVELELALQICPPHQVVFDSPVKTSRELQRALQARVRINIDNLQELQRLQEQELPAEANIGIRINPGIGPGQIEETSTAMAGSKFGIDLGTHREVLTQALINEPWLKGLHVHVGSQGCGMEMLLRGTEAIVELAAEVEARGKKLDWLDLGGGLPVAYMEGEQAPSHADLAQALETRIPMLWEGRYQLITEFGRSLFAPCGFAASRVEYTKQSGGRRIAVIHLGADFLLRAAYRPDQWSHRIRVFDSRGRARTGPLEPWDVAGPLCFSGDLLGRARMLPSIQPGDILCIEDVGAYSLSMWSRYNSRRSPAVHGFQPNGRFRCLRKAETVARVIDFWEQKP
jgi:diaminopimelate decarboxylase